MKSNDSEIIIYQTCDGQTKIDVRMEDETVWPSQVQTADLFQTAKQNIGSHLNNAFEERELVQSATVKEYLTVQKEGSREVVLNRMVSAFFDLAKLRAMQHQPTYMRDWIVERDDFAKRYGKGVLSGAGSVSNLAAIEKAEKEYVKFKPRMVDEPSPVELESLESVKTVQKKVAGIVKQEKLSAPPRELADYEENGGGEE